jgi:hypothetical protein
MGRYEGKLAGRQENRKIGGNVGETGGTTPAVCFKERLVLNTIFRGTKFMRCPVPRHIIQVCFELQASVRAQLSLSLCHPKVKVRLWVQISHQLVAQPLQVAVKGLDAAHAIEWTKKENEARLTSEYGGRGRVRGTGVVGGQCS